MRPSTKKKELWRFDAACTGMDLDMFFPEYEKNSGAAKAVCCFCPVMQTCLLYALANHIQFGIWGGLTARERKRLRRSIDYPDQLNNIGARRSNVRVASNGRDVSVRNNHSVRSL